MAFFSARRGNRVCANLPVGNPVLNPPGATGVAETPVEINLRRGLFIFLPPQCLLLALPRCSPGGLNLGPVSERSGGRVVAGVAGLCELLTHLGL